MSWGVQACSGCAAEADALHDNGRLSWRCAMEPAWGREHKVTSTAWMDCWGCGKGPYPQAQAHQAADCKPPSVGRIGEAQTPALALLASSMQLYHGRR